MENVLFVNKPSGISSFDVCFRLRKVLGTKKIGHTGTLDPMASGVMIVLFDKATKANQFLVSDSKTYETRVLLGVKTDTLDLDGKIIEEKEHEVPAKEKIEEVLHSFLGASMQEVPITSAVSVNGKRLYRYQLEQKEVELPIREIHVYDISLTQIHEDGFSFRAEVSSGTYIRALTRDILNRLDLIGTVKELKRTAVDQIRIEDCDKLSAIEEGNYQRHSLYDLLSLRYETIDYPSTEDILNGKKIKIDAKSDRVLICREKEVLAVYEKEDDHYRCVRGLW